MLIQRRAFLTGLGSLLAAPMVVRAENLMPVRSIDRFLPAFGYESFDSYIASNAATHYQWVADYMRGGLLANGWVLVPAARHNKQFKISGPIIEHGGCTLMQKPLQAVVNSRAKEIQAAHDLVSNWKQRYAEFTPLVREPISTVDFISVSDFGLTKT